MTQALINALQTKLESLSGLNSTNVFYLRSDQDDQYERVVFRGITEESGRMDGYDKQEVDRIQITLYGKDSSALQALYETIKDGLDWAILTVIGWTNIEVRPLTGTPATPFGDVFQITKDYQLFNYKAA